MVIERLLRRTPAAEFLGRHYGLLPYSEPGSGAGTVPEIGWDTVEAILGRDGADAFAAREGARWEGGTPSPAQARGLHAEGYTVLVRHAERHDERLAALAEEFRRDFGGETDVHLYATPAGRFGFGWHYDAEEVFVLQAVGVKEYTLRKNTLHPWPLKETLPRDMGYEKERAAAAMGCRLEPGDWLYVPSGTWHRARAIEDSVSIAVGIAAPAAIEALDLARRRLAASPAWRRRLPPPGRANPAPYDELLREYRAIFAELARDLALEFEDERFARAFLAARGIEPPRRS